MRNVQKRPAVARLTHTVAGGKKYPVDQYRFIVPNAVGRFLGHLKDHPFVCELTEEGILFRPLEIAETKDTDLPTWAKDGSA